MAAASQTRRTCQTGPPTIDPYGTAAVHIVDGTPQMGANSWTVCKQAAEKVPKLSGVDPWRGDSEATSLPPRIAQPQWTA